MHPPRPLALVVFALGVGLVWVGPPARAPAFAQSVDAPPAMSVESNAEAAQAQPQFDAAPSPDVAPPRDADAIQMRAGEAEALRTSGGERPWATTEPAPYPYQRDPRPGDAPPPDAAAGPDAQTNVTDDGALQLGTSDPSAEDLQADLPPVGPPTGTAARLATWVATTGDNDGHPFVIVDKLAADVFVFAPDGSLEGAAPVLVGETPGDDSAEGVGDRDLSAISPDERTTPAGRFVASFGPASGHRTVLWVDYATAISLHPVITTNPAEHRLERLRSTVAEDRRITFGCINVPTAFYQDVVLKAFKGGRAVVYILPDTKPLQDVFPAFATVAQAGGPNDAANDPRRPQDDTIVRLSAPSSGPDGSAEAASGDPGAAETAGAAAGPVAVDAAGNAPAQ